MTDTVLKARANSRASYPLAHLGAVVTQFGTSAMYVTLVVIYLWFGGMKFTAYEAHGIQGLVANSPLLSWMYNFMDVLNFSYFLGVLEISVGLLIAARLVTPAASALGGLISMGLFTTTVTFMFTTPGVIEPSLGFPAISGGTGQFLLKDVGLWAGSVLVLGDSLTALARSRAQR